MQSESWASQGTAHGFERGPILHPRKAWVLSWVARLPYRTSKTQATPFSGLLLTTESPGVLFPPFLLLGERKKVYGEGMMCSDEATISDFQWREELVAPGEIK